jgi:membrane-bound lytic murein transglycosylase B
VPQDMDEKSIDGGMAMKRFWRFGLAAALLAAACTSDVAEVEKPTPAQPTPAPEAAAPPSPPSSAEAPAEEAPKPEFLAWLAALRDEARAKGIGQPTIEAALSDVKPIPRVLELDRAQPEFKLTYRQYMDRVAPASRVEKGRQRIREHKALLDAVTRKYGVPARFVVALWGIETDFGRVTGGFRVVPALATLAYDGRRSAFFRGELLNALTILDGGHATPKTMVGSWAGAMGQVQFMPSSFLRYAVDHDGDGKRDLWGSTADALASAANYLSKSGWRAEENWGFEVRLPPEGFAEAKTDLETKLAMTDWAKRGVTQPNGKPVAGQDLAASMVLPEGAGGPAYLVGDNYRIIMKWNRSHFFALAAGSLADRIGAK